MTDRKKLYFRLIDSIVCDGITVSMSCDKQVYKADLNTQAKSNAYLILRGDTITCERRYGKVDEVLKSAEVIKLVHACACNRSYFNYEWIRLFEALNMSDPRGSL